MSEILKDAGFGVKLRTTWVGTTQTELNQGDVLFRLGFNYDESSLRVDTCALGLPAYTGSIPLSVSNGKLTVPSTEGSATPAMALADLLFRVLDVW